MESATSEEKMTWIEAIEEQVCILSLFEKYQIDLSNLLHYLKLAEKLLILYVISKNETDDKTN